jgi:hypothetical protein
MISHSFAFNASGHLSILVSMLDLSPPLPVFLLLRVGGLSRLNTPVLVYRLVAVFQAIIPKDMLFPLLIKHRQ